MTSTIASERMRLALEKLDTSTNANFDRDAKEDVLNKALNDWIRRQFHGTNQYREQQEESTIRVDDLQVLLIDRSLNFTESGVYVQSEKLPSNYRYYNELTIITDSEECSNIIIPSYFVENANVNHYLADWTFSPDLNLEQCFHTLKTNCFQVYHDNKFKIKKLILSYYRNPLHISMDLDKMDDVWEWKDDVAEVIIDEAVKLLAGYTENAYQQEFSNQRVEQNN